MPVTSLHPTATPGRARSFSPKTAFVPPRFQITRLQVSGIAGRRGSFAAKDEAAPDLTVATYKPLWRPRRGR